MTRPGNSPSQAGFESRIFRSRGGRLNHKASEAVSKEGKDEEDGQDSGTEGQHLEQDHTGQTTMGVSGGGLHSAVGGQIRSEV